MILAAVGGFLIGLISGLCGYPFTTWQFWVFTVPIAVWWGYVAPGIPRRKNDYN